MGALPLLLFLLQSKKKRSGCCYTTTSTNWKGTYTQINYNQIQQDINGSKYRNTTVRFMPGCAMTLDRHDYDDDCFVNNLLLIVNRNKL